MDLDGNSGGSHAEHQRAVDERLDRFAAELAAGRSQVDAFAQSARAGRAQMAAMADANRSLAAAIEESASRMGSPSPVDAGSGGGGTAAAAPDMSAVAGQMRGAMSPMLAFAARMESMFDRLGGTVTTLARRIDSSMKFSATQAALNKLEKTFNNKFVSMGTGAVRSLMSVKSWLSSLGDVAGKTMSQMGMGARGGAAGVKGLQSSVVSATGSVRNLGLEIGAALGIFGLVYKGVEALKGAVAGAANLGETMSKTQAVFGESTAMVVKGADEMAGKFGISKQTFLDSASAIGLIGEAAGQTQGQAAKLGTDFAKLAADVQSFYNVPLDEALGAIRSGLVGESEPMRRFGVLLSETAVTAQATAMGFAKVGGKLSEASKVQARAALITQGLSTAQGDLERTSGSTANQFRNLGGRIQNSMVSVGQAIMPIADQILGLASRAFGHVSRYIEENKGTLESWSNAAAAWIGTVVAKAGEFYAAVQEFMGSASGQLIKDGIGAGLEWLSGVASSVVGAISAGIETVMVMLRNWGEMTEIISLKMQESWTNAGELLTWLGNTAAKFGEWLGSNWVALIRDALTAVGNFWRNTAKNIVDLTTSVWKYLRNPAGGFHFEFTPLLKGFEATIGKLPEIARPALTSLQSEIDKVTMRVSDKEMKRAEKLAADAGKPPIAAAVAAAPPGLRPSPIAEMAAGAEKEPANKFAGAQERGSAEARTTEITAMLGGRDNNPMVAIGQQQVALARQGNQLLGEIAGVPGAKGGIAADMAPKIAAMAVAAPAPALPRNAQDRRLAVADMHADRNQAARDARVNAARMEGNRRLPALRIDAEARQRVAEGPRPLKLAPDFAALNRPHVPGPLTPDAEAWAKVGSTPTGGLRPDAESYRQRAEGPRGQGVQDPYSRLNTMVEGVGDKDGTGKGVLSENKKQTEIQRQQLEVQKKQLAATGNGLGLASFPM